MMRIGNLCILLVLSVGFCSCGRIFDEIEHRAEVIHGFENKALYLVRENRDLRRKITQLEFDVQTLKAQNNYLEIQLKEKGKRKLASVRPLKGVKQDLVKFNIYKWSPAQLLAVGSSEFSKAQEAGNDMKKKQHYEKSAQFFATFFHQFPTSSMINDEVLFKAGLSSFESKDHYDWSRQFFTRLIKDYPTSLFYRGAKLWLALSNLKLGEKDEFYKTVEEFRLRYRNTEEWKVLSKHYDEFTRKYKN